MTLIDGVNIVIILGFVKLFPYTASVIAGPQIRCCRVPTLFGRGVVHGIWSWSDSRPGVRVRDFSYERNPGLVLLC